MKMPTLYVLKEGHLFKLKSLKRKILSIMLLRVYSRVFLSAKTDILDLRMKLSPFVSMINRSATQPLNLSPHQYVNITKYENTHLRSL